MQSKFPSVLLPRKTARLILLNPANKILLINIKSGGIHDPKNPLSKPFWITVGGKVEEGETLFEAAQREGFEETGCREINIQQPLWFGSIVLNWKGVLTELQETFLLARYPSLEAEATMDYLTAEEQQVVQQYKWWSVEELETTEEVIIPKDLPNLLKRILNGETQQDLIHIALSLSEAS